MNFRLILLLIFLPSIVLSHIVSLEDKSVEDIVNKRMGNMSKIKAYSTKMYPLTMAGEFDEIKKVNDELLHAASEFKDLF